MRNRYHHRRLQRLVSIRTRHFCRVMPGPVVKRPKLRLVSIRTRHFCRVMHARQLGGFIPIGVSIRTRHFCRVMQVDTRGDCYSAWVSIRTRHFCRVMLSGDICRAGKWALSFNPHPAFLPGDAWYWHCRSKTCYVSIRTRHFCRVMRHRRLDLLGRRMFQSAPGISAG